MDLFYVPPLQRPDECKALEENYMNCLLQKSMKDRVLTNRCAMDSLLWFHVECPRDAAKFDDPIEFKRKFRNFFAYQRASAELLYRKTDDEKAIQNEFGHARYPEDIVTRKEIVAFKNEFKQHDPKLNPGEMTEEDWLNPVIPDEECDETPNWKDINYDNPIPGFELHDITTADSAKFGSAEPL
jgi:hypothetical protein